MARMSLPWPVDRKGYRLKLVQPQPRPPGALVTPLSEAEPGPHWIIKREGGKLDLVDKLKVACLYHRLTESTGGPRPETPEGALDFVSDFGFLRHRGREPVDFIVGHIREVRRLIEATKREDWDAINLWLHDHRRDGETEVEIGRDKDGRPELHYHPRNLIGAIYLQLLQDATSGTQYKWCLRPGCPEYFYYGPNTGHRSTAKYCSDRCRVKHFEERKQREQSK